MTQSKPGFVNKLLLVFISSLLFIFNIDDWGLITHFEEHL